MYIGALAVFCIAALVIGSAGASAMMQKGTGYLSNNTFGKGPMHGVANEERMSLLLTNLTAKGYDVSAISAAVTSGDYKTAMTLIKEFRTTHPEAFPVIGDGNGKGPMHGVANEERMSQLLTNLTAKGYDVSAISAAVTSGNLETAMTLLKEFRTANPDAFPAFSVGTGKGPMKGEANETRMLEMLDNLTAKGYDVSAIRTSVEGGDYETAMTLLKEFMTANPDARPARGDGTGSGHMGGQRRAQKT
jgi:hypothetical protein